VMRNVVGRTLGIITVAAFWLAAAIYLWKLVVDGPAPLTVIAAVCFALGGMIRLLVLLRDRKAGDTGGSSLAGTE
jgi:hypothetical protein